MHYDVDASLSLLLRRVSALRHFRSFRVTGGAEGFQSLRIYYRSPVTFFYVSRPHIPMYSILSRISIIGSDAHRRTPLASTAIEPDAELRCTSFSHAQFSSRRSSYSSRQDSSVSGHIHDGLCCSGQTLLVTAFTQYAVSPLISAGHAITLSRHALASS
jgi:hypothetical protein